MRLTATTPASAAPTGGLERDSARLVHCLDALTRPVETPEAVLEAGLSALSGAFQADVVCLVRTGAPGSAGVPRDVAAFTHGLPGSGWLDLPELPGALATPDGPLARTASWSAEHDGGHLVFQGVEVLAGARLAPHPEDPTSSSVLVMRRAPLPFTPAEVRLLAALAGRLLSAARGAESRRRAEMLARAGTVLGGHLPPLTPALASLLAELAGATWAGVVVLEGGSAALAGRHGRPLVDEGRWPGVPAGPGPHADLREELLLHDAAISAGVLTDLRVRSVLRVPVLVGAARRPCCAPPTPTPAPSPPWWWPRCAPWPTPRPPRWSRRGCTRRSSAASRPRGTAPRTTR